MAVVLLTTLLGLSASAARGGVVTVSVAVRVVVPWLAAMVIAVSAATATVVTGKVAVVAPAARVTPGRHVRRRVAAGARDGESPAGAGVPRATVPVEEASPETLAGPSRRQRARWSAASASGRRCATPQAGPP